MKDSFFRVIILEKSLIIIWAQKAPKTCISMFPTYNQKNPNWGVLHVVRHFWVQYVSSISWFYWAVGYSGYWHDEVIISLSKEVNWNLFPLSVQKHCIWKHVVSIFLLNIVNIKQYIMSMRIWHISQNWTDKHTGPLQTTPRHAILFLFWHYHTCWSTIKYNLFPFSQGIPGLPGSAGMDGQKVSSCL